MLVYKVVKAMLGNLQLHDDRLSVDVAQKVGVAFDYFWLRDNARDPISFDSRSHQRELYTGGVAPDIRPVEAEISSDTAQLMITWPDLDAPVAYDAAFLDGYTEVSDPMVLPAATIWNRDTLDGDRLRLPFDDVMAEGGIDLMLSTLARDGFAVLTGTPCSQQSVAAIIDKVGYVRETIFGGLWEFEANEDMADSAFTPKELRPHTDGTYSHDAPGLQMLLCVDYDATGGESIMVDGLQIAADIKREDPALFADMTRIGVTGLYKGDGVELRARRPIFRLGPDGEIAQVTFNNYDRDTVRLPDADMRQLYAAIRNFEARANAPEYQWRYTLKPGEMLVFDNWRVLHGRGAFQGRRKMSGAYVNREDYESCVRMRGLC